MSCFCLTCLTERLFGQEYRGSISGRVLDPSAAAVPAARVSVVNAATGVRLTTDTNAEGNYTVPYLQPGTYSLRVEHEGFKAFERRPIEVRIDQVVQLDAQLELGSSTETINVQGETPLLDTGSASAGQTIDSKRITELPTQQGVPFHLIALSAGVVRTGSTMLDENPYDWGVITYSVGGANPNSNIVTIDGAVTGGFQGGTTQPSFSPPQESVGELRVLTSNYDAAQGFTQGANLSVSLKSGTNAPHGAVYYYAGGNGNLIANQYFNVIKGLPKSPSGPYFRVGGGFGGPVFIPKAYDGRSRTFFHVGYEAIHRTQVLTQSFTVPTLEERNGDFSALLAVGPTYQMYDPFSRTPAANGRVRSLPLAGNLIPKSRLDPIAMGLLKYWPLPNTNTGTADGTNNYYSNTRGQQNTYWAFDVRVDHNFSARHRMYGSMHRYDRISNTYNIYNNDVSGAVWDVSPRGAVIDDVFIVNPTLIVNVRFGYGVNDRLVDSLGAATRNWRYAANGFPSSMDALVDPTTERMPAFNPTGYSALPAGASLEFYKSHTWTPSVHVTKTRGAHTMNLGWEMVLRQENEFVPSLGATGSYGFNGSYLVGPLDNSPAAPLGQGLAQMLYGLPSTASINRQPNFAAESNSHGLYFQEDWRVSRRLTLNLGLRYEYWGPTSERFNRTTAGWDPSAALPIAPLVQAKYLLNPTPEVKQLPVQGGLLFAGGKAAGLWAANHDFMPRIGVSYSLNDKTVLHGGYGIFYAAGGIQLQAPIQTGFARTTTTNATLDNGLTYPNTLANPFPDGVLEPTGASLGAMTNLGNGMRVINTTPRGLSVQRWELNVQRELAGRVVVSAGYNGNRGTHLVSDKNLNALPNPYLSTSAVRDQATINYLTTNIANPFYPLLPATGLSNATVARTQLLLPYPQFTGVTLNTQQGYSWYHSLQVTAEKRLSKGFTAQASYTWSKDMEASTFLNAGDPLPTRMIATVDRPHYFALSSIYEFPVGRGKALLGNSSKLLNAMVGGWQIQGVYRFQSGPPLGFNNALLNGSCTWKQIALPSDQRNVYKWFNTSCFVTASNQQLAYNLVTMPSRFSYLRGDSLSVLDVSMIKTLKVTETIGVEFRAEFLNAFNREWLGSVNVTPTSAAFGQSTYEQSAPRRVYLSLRVKF